MDDPRILKKPDLSTPVELTPEAAYLAAITSLPRLLSDIGKVLTGILETLDDINGSLDTISLYHERKGTSEKLFSPEDFNETGTEPHE